VKTRDLVNELSKHIESSLAYDLVEEFVRLRNDCKTGTLGGSAAGKFVETVVQVLQYLETGKYDSSPRVDAYLREVQSRKTLPDDLRICCARVARACYALRNKRNIAHKGNVSPNIYDLRYCYSCAQWLLSELVRHIISGDMDIAGKMIEFIQVPISPIVEEFDGRRLVHGDFTVEQEILVLLHSYYPEEASRKQIGQSLDRRARSSVSNSLTRLWKKKMIHRSGAGYKLSQEGFKEAAKILRDSLSGNLPPPK